MGKTRKLGLAGFGLIGLLNTACTPLAIVGSGYMVSEQMMLDRQQRTQQQIQNPISVVPKSRLRRPELFRTTLDQIGLDNNESNANEKPRIVYGCKLVGHKGLYVNFSMDNGLTGKRIDSKRYYIDKDEGYWFFLPKTPEETGTYEIRAETTNENGGFYFIEKDKIDIVIK